MSGTLVLWTYICNEEPGVEDVDGKVILFDVLIPQI